MNNEHFDDQLDEDFQDEFIAENDIAEEYALEEGQPDFMPDEEGEMVTEEQTEFIDDSIQGFFDHHEPVYTIAFHPTNPIVCFTGGGDDKSYIWAIDTGEKLFDIGVHSDSVSSVCFNFDGSYCASGGLDGKVFIFRVEDGELINTLEGPSEISWLNWHPRGNVLIAGSEDGTIWMWNIPSGQCMHVFSGHVESVSCGQFTPDGKLIVTGSIDGSIIIWDPRTGAPLHKWTAQDGRFHQAPITTLAVNPESAVILSAAQDGSSLLLKIEDHKILGPIEAHGDSVESIDYAKNLPLVATSSVDGRIHVFDTATMKLRYTVQHDDAVTKVKFNPVLPTLLSSSVDGTLRQWDARTGQLLKTFNGHQNSILDFAIRSDGKVAVTASDDGTSLVFSLE